MSPIATRTTAYLRPDRSPTRSASAGHAPPAVVFSLLACLLPIALGCGSLKSQIATEQLLVADAIEQSVDQFDFRDLAGANVFLDTSYMGKASHGILTVDYIRSALRQRMLTAGCYLQDSKDTADYIVEARISALGTDGHEINYGVPASRALSTTASIFTSSPVVPALPEVSLARKDERTASVQLHLFAYHRDTMQPVWQPDVALAHSRARSTWVLGAGPFQRGSIYEKTRFAGKPIDTPDIPIESVAKWSLKDYFMLRPLTESLTELVTTPITKLNILRANAEESVPTDARQNSTGDEPAVAFSDYGEVTQETSH
ncbi:MAG: hypothetical protein KDA60_04750 [Planctomycetales bacterium]|nr:hypothetical protein [Planctomycetales bacterium]